MKKILILTTTRADYGILLPLIRRVMAEPSLTLRLVVSGTHLSEAHGMTLREIEADGIPIACRIPILADGDGGEAVSCAMANSLIGLSRYLEAEHPDMAIVLGDRSETMAFCAALTNAHVPIAHLHGGETTEGAVDECYRHCITKMSYLHFTSNAAHSRRVIQLGEEPRRVFNVGALGVENALHTDFLSREQLADCISDRVLGKPRYAVVTFHPVTLENDTAIPQCKALQSAMDCFPDMGFLCTMANADAGGAAVNGVMKEYAERRDNVQLVPSLGMRRYLSALKYSCMALGNSSSGIIEAPSFGIPTVNIGDRQRGRMQADSVINCEPETEAIYSAMRTALTDGFRARASAAVNPYGSGDTSERIMEVLLRFLNNGQIDLKKRFYDLNFEIL